MCLFRFVSFRKVSEAAAAIRNLDNCELFDKENKLKVKLARETGEGEGLRFGGDTEREMEKETWDYAEGSGSDSTDATDKQKHKMSGAQPEFRDTRTMGRPVEKYAYSCLTPERI